MGRRLTFLVAAQIATALALLLLGFASVRSLASSSQFMHRFVLVPIQGIGAALDDVARMGRDPPDRARDELLLQRVESFVTYYHDEVELAGNSGPDARRHKDELRELRRLSLIDQEQQVVTSLRHSLDRISGQVKSAAVQDADVELLRLDLRDLLRINLEFVDAAQNDITRHAARVGKTLVLIGLFGIGLAGALGWRVRGAIAPRIADLVRRVRKFTEYGVFERLQVRGRDDIAVLGSALDVGFAAIAERNRERERFLAVAAHELKTPMASILGFTQAALANQEQCERALQVVRRQTLRMSRLVEDLLWSTRARSGDLPFNPVPLDVAKLARQLADEVGEAVPSHPIAVVASPSVRLLADEPLITHALWSLLCYAGLLSAPERPIELDVERSGSHVFLKLRIEGSPLPPEDQVRIFEPFATLQYEGDGRPRSALGLFLCREIARIHSGSLRAGETEGIGPVLTLDLPG